VCPSSDSVVQKDAHGVIQQLVCKHREQVLPTYLVHFAAGARHHGHGIQATPANQIVRRAAGRRGQKTSYVPPPLPLPLPLPGSALGGVFGLIRGFGSAPLPPVSSRASRPPSRHVNAISDDSDDDDDDSDFKTAIALSLRTTASAAAAASAAASPAPTATTISRATIIDMSDS